MTEKKLWFMVQGLTALLSGLINKARLKQKYVHPVACCLRWLSFLSGCSRDGPAKSTALSV